MASTPTVATYLWLTRTAALSASKFIFHPQLQNYISWQHQVGLHNAHGNVSIIEPTPAVSHQRVCRGIRDRYNRRHHVYWPRDRVASRTSELSTLFNVGYDLVAVHNHDWRWLYEYSRIAAVITRDWMCSELCVYVFHIAVVIAQNRTRCAILSVWVSEHQVYTP